MPVNVNIFRNRVLAEVKMRSQWISVGPKVNDCCPYEQKGRTRRDMHAGKKAVWRQKKARWRPWAETGVIHLQTKDSKDGRKATEARKRQSGILPRNFRGRMALPTPWLQASILQSHEKIHFCCIKPPSFWYFVTAACYVYSGRSNPYFHPQVF